MYNPSNWYWIVGGSTTQVYSSARAAYCPITDSAYSAWLEAGNFPTKIDTEENLQAVFASQFPSGWPASPAQEAIAAGMASLNAGVAITSTSTPAINGTYALSSNTLLMLTGAVAYCIAKNQFPGNSSTLTFFDAAGAAHVFNSIAEFEAFAEAIASYINPIQDYINSGGTQGALPTSNAVTIA